MDYSNFKFWPVAAEAEVAQRKAATKNPFGRRIGPRESKKSSGLEISDELLSYLKLIRDNPGVPATQRDKAAEISLKKGSQLRKRLMQIGLIEQIEVSPGGWGRNFRDVTLTTRAQRLCQSHKSADA